mgnify:CR=1 FL=1
MALRFAYKYTLNVKATKIAFFRKFTCLFTNRKQFYTKCVFAHGYIFVNSKAIAQKAKNALTGTAGAGAIDPWSTIFKLDPNDAGIASDNIGATARILADNIALNKDAGSALKLAND